MSLADYYDKEEGGQFLPVGEFHVNIKEYRTFEANSGNKGVDFTVQDPSRRICKTDGFWLTDAAMPRLAGFAKAAGMTREAMAGYEPLLPQSHQALIGRELMVGVTMEDGKDGKQYSRVTSWWPVEAVQPATTHQHAPPPGDVPHNTAPNSPPADDIPF